MSLRRCDQPVSFSTHDRGPSAVPVAPAPKVRITRTLVFSKVAVRSGDAQSSPRGSRSTRFQGLPGRQFAEETAVPFAELLRRGPASGFSVQPRYGEWSNGGTECMGSPQNLRERFQAPAQAGDCPAARQFLSSTGFSQPAPSPYPPRPMEGRRFVTGIQQT